MNEPLTWQQIPGWFNFDDVYQEAVDRAPSTGAHFVEIGVMFGKSTFYMAESIKKSSKQIAFDAIDSWTYNYENLKNFIDTHGRTSQQQKLLDELFQSEPKCNIASHFLQLSGLENFVKLVRAKGQLWAHNYPAESLDFIYVDAEHTYEDTEQILRAYLPKLRHGGVLAGHDYNSTIYPGLHQAVHDVLGTKITVRRQSFVWTKE